MSPATRATKVATIAELGEQRTKLREELDAVVEELRREIIEAAAIKVPKTELAEASGLSKVMVFRIIREAD